MVSGLAVTPRDSLISDSRVAPAKVGGLHRISTMQTFSFQCTFRLPDQEEGSSAGGRADGQWQGPTTGV